MKRTFAHRAGFLHSLLVLVVVLGTLTTSHSSGATINVPAGGDFQAALNSAQPGDTITLQAGATYMGPFRLPAKTGSSFITIRTSAPDGQLPAANMRIDPSYAGVMPKIVASSTAAIYADLGMGAHHFKFVGVEIAPTAGTYLYNVVLLGDGSETSLSMVPHDIVFDRVYIHGDLNAGSRRGIAANGANISVINSYLAEFKEIGADSQAIMCWNGPGPLLIQNNFLQAAGENMMIGGGDPKIPNLVPSNITVKNNYFFKPTSWRGLSWTVKNIFELKNANNVTVDSNVFENVWAAAQSGFAIQFTPRNQDGTAPWSVVSNVKFTNNIIRHAASGVNILGYDNINQSAQGHDFTIANNLFIDVSSANWGGYGRLFQVLNNARNVTFSHNTGFADGSVLFADLEPSTGFVYQNNLATNGQYGVLGTDYASGTSTLAHYFPGYIFSANAIIGAPNSGSYPSGNFFPAGIANVGFVNYSNGNYALSSGSPYYTAGSNGTSIGVDTTALNSALTAVSAVSTTSSSTTTGSSSSGTTTGSSSGTTTGSSGSSSTGTTTRIEQNASGVTYSGAWTSNNYSGQSRGSAVLAADAGSRASLTFTGTGVNWIGFRDAWSGLANVYLNGVLKDTVDTYAATDGYQVPLWSISGLPYGPYTLDVEVAGKKNAASNGYWVWVDAFDVTTATTTSPSTVPSPSKASTTISAVRGSGPSGGTAAITATLTSGGSGLSGKDLSFTLNGAAAGTAATDSLGVATLSGVSLTGINAGSYPTAVAASFADEASYSGSNASGALTVTSTTVSTPPSTPPPPASNTSSSSTPPPSTTSYLPSSQTTSIPPASEPASSTPTTPPPPTTSTSSTTPPTATGSLVGGQSRTTTGASSMRMGSAAVIASAGQSAPSGVAIFGYRRNGVLLSEAGVPGVAPALRGRIFADVAGPVNTGLAIANENDTAATVSFYFTNANGGDFGNGSVTIPAHGQIARFLDEAPFNGSRPINGTFTFSSNVAVSAVAIRGLTNERSEFLVTTLPVADPDTRAYESVFFTHFADGGGCTTQFILVNPSDQTITGQLSFFGQGTAGGSAPGITLNIDGSSVSEINYSIPARSARRFSTVNASSQMRMGSARVAPGPFNPAPVGVAVFSLRSGGVTVAEAGTPSSRPGNAFRMYAEADENSKIETAIAIRNTGSADTTVNFQLTSLDGSAVGLSGNLRIPASGQRSLFLNQIPGLESLTTPFKGVLRISSDNANVTVLGVRGRWNERSDFIFTTTPATDENAPAHSMLVFPQIVDGGGYTTQFITFTGTPGEASSGNLQLFSQSGGNLNLNVQ